MGGPGSIFEIESFLKRIFTDPLILNIKSEFGRKMLANFITHQRLDEAKRNYQLIGGKSPIIEHTLKITQRLNELDSERFYTYAMRYTAPFAYDVLDDIKKQGFESVILFSMYPQFCRSTIYSSIVDAKNALKSLNFQPQLHIISDYATHPSYIQCAVQKIKESLAHDNPQDFLLLLSAHSLPLSRIKQGDPYQNECEANLKAIQESLEKENINFKKILLAYQSKVGMMKWLGPSTQETLNKYKKHKLILYPLSFTVDNSETIYELCIQYAHLARDLGIPEYRVCKCFNDDEMFIQAILRIINEHIHDSHSHKSEV